MKQQHGLTVQYVIDVILATWAPTQWDLISSGVHLFHSISFFFTQTFHVLNHIILINSYSALNYVLLVIMPCW